MRAALTWIATAAFSAATWFAWMGWDGSGGSDPGNGSYHWWQIAGSGLSLAVVVVLATLTFRDRPQVALAATAGYTIAWSTAELPDDGGLSVGLVLLVLGVGATSFALAYATEALRSQR
jgi:hypothetical protein